MRSYKIVVVVSHAWLLSRVVDLFLKKKYIQSANALFSLELHQ